MSCRAPRPHRCDEFPAEYCLASCSPALLASACSALMLQPTTFVRRANLSERQPGNFLFVSLEGGTAQVLSSCRLRTRQNWAAKSNREPSRIFVLFRDNGGARFRSSMSAAILF